MEEVVQAISNAIEIYHELNAAIVDEWTEEPSPLEFMRYVSKNRPFVVRQAAVDWEAFLRWDADYLRETMGKEEVQVAVTPLGNADAIVQHNGQAVFVEPHETSGPFIEFLDYVIEDSRGFDARKESSRPVKYAQTQNDNLREEYQRLFSDVPPDIPFARIALEKEADAINLWIGNERSTTSLHKDNYENIYVQIRGQKHFVLLSPTEMPCVNEQVLPRGRYVQITEDGRLEIEIEENTEPSPVPTWDPDEPGKSTSAFSHLAKPLRVTLQEGDMLYLPAMWYHKVSQTAGEEGFACAVNYWYDMSFEGGFWTANSFLRDVAAAVGSESA